MNYNLPHTHNKNMYVVFFIFLLLLLIITFPLYLKIYFRFNINANTGYVQIQLLKINIIYYNIKVKNKNVVLYNKKNIKKMDFEINKEKINFVNQIQKELFKRLFLNKMMTSIDFGVKNNPFLVALLIGFIKTTLNIIYGIISYQKPTSNLNYKINTYNNINLVILNLNILLSISLVNIFLAFINAKKNITIKKRKEQNFFERKFRIKN